MVFVGSTGTPTAHCGNVDGRPYVVEPATPVVAEKPFLTIDSAGRYYLNVPGPKYESIGVDQGQGESISGGDAGEVFGFHLSGQRGCEVLCGRIIFSHFAGKV